MSDVKTPEGIVATPPDEPPSEQEIQDIATPQGRQGLLSVFRHRNYRLFFAGQLVSLMGTWMQNVAQAWLVYSLTHSPFLLGLTSFCSMVTVFFITPFGGMVADRVDRRRMLLLTQSAAMLQATILAVLTLTGVVQVWEIIALALCMGLINSFDVPSRQSMTLDMVGREDLRHAISLNSMMFNAARVIGPSLAGALIAVVGEGICFALNAASFAAVLTSLYLMRLPQRVPRIVGHPLREIQSGYRYSFNSPQIRVSLMLVGVSSMFGAAYLTLMPAFARDLLHGTSTAYGTLMTSIGAGALIGAYFLSRLHEKYLAYAPVAAAIAFGVGIIAFSHSHILWLSVLLLLPTSASLMLLGGTTNTIIQMVAHEDYRGRVISHYTQAFMGMMPWGSLLLGTLASHLGVTTAVTIGGCVTIASALVALLNRRASGFQITQAAE
ncbi:MAG TPA: MFS transporter [Rhizomicrobium sp.]|jgi:MFS family permease|nr:MFS transporter [Rhizomicrobium sp.]